MQSDSRTVYSITSGTEAIEVSETGLVSTKSGVSYTGTVTIGVTFPTYQSALHISTSVSLTVVAFTAITTNLVPYPSYNNGFSDAKQLGRLMCSKVYQITTISVTGHLSNGQTTTITSGKFQNDINILLYQITYRSFQ